MKIAFINSKDHWTHGWFTSPPDLEIALKILKGAGIELQSIEVASLYQLENALDKLPMDTLIWPNAYFVNDEHGKPVWLNERLEARNLPIIGSSAKTLQMVLKKDECQSMLAEQGLPIPAFEVITRENVANTAAILAANIAPPYVLKPTCESGSIGVCKVESLAGAEEAAMKILKDFPHSEVIVEEFLPSDDITCGFLQLGDKYMLLPTAYIVKSVAGKANILSRKERLRTWDDVDKMQPYITDKTILEQLSTYILPIVKTLDIKGITRIDGRLDKYGTLRFFDVNGLPALCFPDAVIVKQCFSCFPNYDKMEVFEGLVYTVVKHALMMNNMEIPAAMQKHDIFRMESAFVISGKMEMKEMLQNTF